MPSNDSKWHTEMQLRCFFRNSPCLRFTDVVKCGEVLREVRGDEGKNGNGEKDKGSEYGAGARNDQFPA
jgi:hypothetical protein